MNLRPLFLLSYFALLLCDSEAASAQSQEVHPGRYFTPMVFPKSLASSKCAVGPKVVESYAPYIPYAEWVNHHSGSATIGMTVSPDGRPRDFKVLSATTKGFADVAITALRKWRFTPAKKNGRPVPSEVVIPFQFKMR